MNHTLTDILDSSQPFGRSPLPSPEDGWPSEGSLDAVIDVVSFKVSFRARALVRLLGSQVTLRGALYVDHLLCSYAFNGLLFS